VPGQVDYQVILLAAISDHLARHSRQEFLLHELAARAARLQSALPGSDLSRAHESDEEFAEKYLAFDLCLMDACEAMSIPVFLVDAPLRETERERVLAELDGLGMFA
jgi:hypothetical protein